MRAVALLSFWKIKNALRSLFTDPRKLIPVVLMLVLMAFPLAMYFGMIAVSHNMIGQARRQAVQSRLRLQALQPTKANPSALNRLPFNGANPAFRPPAFSPRVSQLDPAVFTSVVTLALILVGLGVISTGLGDRLLALSPPDVDYLFPAPVSRRVVLAYRLPALTLKAVGVALFLVLYLTLFTASSMPNMPNPGTTVSPWWVNPAALFFSGGIYFNLAMFLSIRFGDRSFYKKVLFAGALALGAAFGFVAWQKGMDEAAMMLQSPVLRVVFLPSSLTTDAIIATYSHRSATGILTWLFLGYAGSLVPMFASTANWYEQSIVSTEKMAALRQAAKGGMAGVMAAKAATTKRKSDRPYAVSPFGQGAVALFWAHLCAAVKKPFANFGVPVLAGAVLGGAGAKIIRAISASLSTAALRSPSFSPFKSIGYTVLGLLAFYCWQGFMTTSRTASEASIRRRELIAPLPIPGWQSVAADLGVPFMAVVICFITAAIAYIAMGGPNWPLVAFIFALTVPLRLIGRITLQHIIVIAYPDLADKIQRLLSMIVNTLVSSPFIIVEAIVCIPGLLFRSFWGVAIPLTLIQIPLVALCLFLAGKASEKAIASGEPVKILSLVRSRT